MLFYKAISGAFLLEIVVFFFWGGESLQMHQQATKFVVWCFQILKFGVHFIFLL